VATSGDLWQYVEIRGRRYSHIIDPRTGQALTERSSVTVVAPDGMTADGLASALSVLGPEKGLALADAMPGVAALIVRAPKGKLEVHESRRWKELPKAQHDRTTSPTP
jgi:thiamine biosynthesis lipoprotein